jgi:hypothetical protein
MVLLGSLAVIGSAGAEEVLEPPNVVVPPPNEAVPPPNETVPPPDEAVPPANETVPPANETPPPPNEAVPPPSFVVPPSRYEQVSPLLAGALPREEFVPSPGTEESPFQYGPLTLRPHMFYRFLYGTGILSSPGHPQKTTINTISPGLLAEIGSHWILDYTPTWHVYSNHSFRDTFRHDVALEGHTVYEEWELRLFQSYLALDTPLIETGQQTDRQMYLTTLQAKYHFGSKMTLEMAGSQDIRDAPGIRVTRDWSTLDWLNCQFQPEFGAALGIGVGYVNTHPGFDQTYEQYQGRVTWQVTPKISLIVRGGLEDRQSRVPGSVPTMNLIGAALIQYQLSTATALSLRADRTVVQSLLTNQVIEVTNFSVALTQQLLERLYFNLETGYDYDRYSFGRRDNHVFVDTRLISPFLKRGTLAAFYRFVDDDSTQIGFGFVSHQFGIEFQYRY